MERITFPRNASTREMLRGPNGKFVRQSIPSSESLHLRDRRRRRSAINDSKGWGYFTSFLDSAICPGENNDWIGAESNALAMVLSEDLFKASYLPSTNSRLAEMRSRFLNTTRVTKQTDVALRTIPDGSKVSGFVRKRIYRDFRHLRVNCSREINSFMRWIRKAFEEGILKSSSIESAEDIARKAFGSYKKRNGAFYYEGYPRKRNARASSSPTALLQSISADEITPTSNDPPEMELEHSLGLSQDVEPVEFTRQMVHELLCAEPGSNGPGNNVSFPEMTGPDLSRVMNREQGSVFEIAPDNYVLAEDDRVFLKQVDRIWALAVKDKIFFLLCKIDDDMRDCKVGFVATSLLKNHEKGICKIDVVILDALRYARSIQTPFAPRSENAQHLKERVQRNVAILKIARRVLGLKPYEGMRWDDVTIHGPEIRASDAQNNQSTVPGEQLAEIRPSEPSSRTGSLVINQGRSFSA